MNLNTINPAKSCMLDLCFSLAHGELLLIPDALALLTSWSQSQYCGSMKMAKKKVEAHAVATWSSMSSGRPWMPEEVASDWRRCCAASSWRWKYNGRKVPTPPFMNEKRKWTGGRAFSGRPFNDVLQAVPTQDCLCILCRILHDSNIFSLLCLICFDESHAWHVIRLTSKVVAKEYWLIELAGRNEG